MRRHRAEKREATPDAKYNSVTIARFINCVMVDGKKSISERIVYSALDILRQKTGEDDVVKTFNKVLDNVRPRLELKPRRMGGATYQIPIEVAPLRGTAVAMRWIRDFARTKKGRSMIVKLADELLAAFKAEGPAVKKRDETHKMAEANKAYAHLRW